MKETKFKVGDLVRFKLKTRDRLLGGTKTMYGKTAQEMYPYKFELGVVVSGLDPAGTYVSFPSRPRAASYISDHMELVSASR